VPPRFSPGGFRIFDADLLRRSAKHFMLVKQSKIGSINHSQMGKQLFQWIGFKEALQESPIFHGENPWFPVKIFPSTNPVIICKK